MPHCYWPVADHDTAAAFNSNRTFPTHPQPESFLFLAMILENRPFCNPSTAMKPFVSVFSNDRAKQLLFEPLAGQFSAMIPQNSFFLSQLPARQLQFSYQYPSLSVLISSSLPLTHLSCSSVHWSGNCGQRIFVFSNASQNGFLCSSQQIYVFQFYVLSFGAALRPAIFRFQQCFSICRSIAASNFFVFSAMLPKTVSFGAALQRPNFRCQE